MKNIIREFWNHIENQNTNVSKRIHDWLNRDNLSSIILDNGVYWIELTSSYSTIPNYIFDYIKKYMNKRGYKYLYDI